jgi:hypothetical protein
MRKSVFRYSVNWIEDVPNVAPEERATVGNLKLFLNDQNVTMHLRDEQAFDHVTVSLYPLIEGLVHDWWTIFGDRDQQISLTKYRSGFALPDIRFQFDGDAFEISAVQRTYQNPDIRFWAGQSEVLSRADAETALNSVIEYVLARLTQKELSKTSAALRWARVVASRGDVEEAAFCECAGALGRDPYAADNSLSNLIYDAALMFANESLNEFLAGAKNFSAEDLLKWIRSAESRSTGKSTMHDLSEIACEVATASPVLASERAWSLGYRRARAAREVMKVPQASRFKTLQSLAQMFGASHNFSVADRIDGIRALRSDHNGVVSIHLRDHGTSSEAASAARFSFARAVGDVICFPEPTRAVINDLHFAIRQSAGRAFAAEFLAPIEEIQSMRRDGHDVVTIAEEFDVSSVLIDHQIENASRIAEACRS